MRRCLFLLVAVLLGFGACGRSAGTTETENLPRGAGVVAKHVDGDTIRVQIGGSEERVRLIGIDTPETHGRNGLVECFGKQASEHLATLLPVGTAVRLVRDVEPRDRYERLLAYVYRADDQLFVNLAMARDGYADVLTYPPNVAHSTDFVAAVADARRNERGLWQACGSADVPVE